MKIEKRFTTDSFKEAAKGIVEGYAVLWNHEDVVNGRPETFMKNSLYEGNHGVSLYYQHDSRGKVLANTKAGTLEIKSDSKGLWYKAKLPETALAERESLSRGDIQGVSISFYSQKEKMESKTRVIELALLDEISLVDKPALTTTLNYRSRGKVTVKVRWSEILGKL